MCIGFITTSRKKKKRTKKEDNIWFNSNDFPEVYFPVIYESSHPLFCIPNLLVFCSWSWNALHMWIILAVFWGRDLDWDECNQMYKCFINLSQRITFNSRQEYTILQKRIFKRLCLKGHWTQRKLSTGQILWKIGRAMAGNEPVPSGRARKGLWIAPK